MGKQNLNKARFNLKEILRLFRLAIAFTPVADVLIGALAPRLAEGALPALADLALACGASTAAFCFGTAMNDCLDLEKDRALAPERPLPSGKLTLATAWTAALGMALLSLGLALCAGWRTACAIAVVLLLVAFYNLFSRRWDWFGVLNLGLIRGADLFVGFSLLPEWPASWWSFSGEAIPMGYLVLTYGGYGIALSVTALGERGQRDLDIRIPATLAAAFALLPLILAIQRGLTVPGLVLWAILALPIFRYFDQGPGKVEHLIGHLVSGFFLMGALWLLVSDHPLPCLFLWLGFFLSRSLSRRFPPA